MSDEEETTAAWEPGARDWVADTFSRESELTTVAGRAGELLDAMLRATPVGSDEQDPVQELAECVERLQRHVRSVQRSGYDVDRYQLVVQVDQSAQLATSLRGSLNQARHFEDQAIRAIEDLVGHPVDRIAVRLFAKPVANPASVEEDDNG